MHEYIDTSTPRLEFSECAPGGHMFLTKKLARRLHQVEESSNSTKASVDRLGGQIADLGGRLEQIQRSIDRLVINPTHDIPRQIAEIVGYKGDHNNYLYRGFIGTTEPMSHAPYPVPFGSSLCHQHHFALDQYRWWVKAMKDKPVFFRKQWEFVYIAQALFERGMLQPGKCGLGFGVGTEPLPSLFASFGAAIVATDQSLETAIASGWVSTNQHSIDLSALNHRGICTNRMIEELASFRAVDMNNIDRDLDGQFDFCWSACAFEHLGSLRHGADFVINSIRTLKPGGIAVHTTEYNISSNDDTYEDPNVSIYRRKDIEKLIADLESNGYEVSPIDWSLGSGFAESVVDLPPFGRGEPHIRLKSADYDTTSIGIIIKKPD